MRLQDVRASRADVGRMTAAMRAAATPGEPRALRVAVVVGGRIVEERMFRERRRVEATFGDGVRFEVVSGAFVLCAPSGATGRVLAGGGRFAIGPAATRLVLDEQARGKVVTGRATVLFQLVAPAPRPSAPKLPLAARRATVDWPLAVIAAFSFLVHFGVLGAMFSDWMDPVVDDDGAVVRLVDEAGSAAAPPVEDREPGTSGRAAARSSTTTSTRPSGSRSRSSSTRAASLAREGEAMKMGLLASFGGHTAVEGALDRAELPAVDLDQVARDAKGAKATGQDLALARGSPVVPGSRRLLDYGDTRGTFHGGRAREIDGPKVQLTMTPVAPPETFIDVLAPIARLRPSFRSCYVRKGLSVDPTMEGKVTLDIAIAPNGDVASVTKLSGEGLSAAVEQCILDRARNASFPAPGAGGAHARVPVVFRRQP